MKIFQKFRILTLFLSLLFLGKEILLSFDEQAEMFNVFLIFNSLLIVKPDYKLFVYGMNLSDGLIRYEYCNLSTHPPLLSICTQRLYQDLSLKLGVNFIFSKA